MTLHPLTSKEGAFVLKLGLVFRQGPEPIRAPGFFFICSQAARAEARCLFRLSPPGRARSQSALRAFSLSAAKPPAPKRVACFVYLRQAGPGANPCSGLFLYLQSSRPSHITAVRPLAFLRRDTCPLAARPVEVYCKSMMFCTGKKHFLFPAASGISCEKKNRPRPGSEADFLLRI